MKSTLKNTIKNFILTFIVISFLNIKIISSNVIINENDYSFMAIYHSEQENEEVPLINTLPSEIISMNIDGGTFN